MARDRGFFTDLLLYLQGKEPTPVWRKVIPPKPKRPDRLAAGQMRATLAPGGGS